METFRCAVECGLYTSKRAITVCVILAILRPYIPYDEKN